MTTPQTMLSALKDRPRPEIVAHSVPGRVARGLDWVTTTDHKKIGIMYMVTDLRVLPASAASRRC